MIGRVDVFTVPDGIHRKCSSCRRSLTDGSHAVTLTVIVGEKKRLYLIAGTPVECCGQMVEVPFVVPTEQQAKDHRMQVLAQLREKGTTEGLLYTPIQR